MYSLRQASLPDGTRVFTVRPHEVAQLYPQVQTYCRHGIRAKEGDIVFDVGANIGLFALWLRRAAGRNITVYSFEPIPAIFEALRHNAQRFGDDNWKVFPCGLGRCPGRATFGYCSRAPALSSAYPDTSPEARVTMRNTLLRNADEWPRGVRWARRLPRFILRPCVDYVIRRVLTAEKVDCPVRTVSQVVREQGVPRIDLLKVDVEKAELDVLEGVEPHDWGLIRQVVAEVHDLDGRLAKVTALLQQNGLGDIAVEQEPVFRGSEIYNLYARRTGGATGGWPSAVP